MPELWAEFGTSRLAQQPGPVSAFPAQTISLFNRESVTAGVPFLGLSSHLAQRDKQRQGQTDSSNHTAPAARAAGGSAPSLCIEFPILFPCYLQQEKTQPLISSSYPLSNFLFGVLSCCCKRAAVRSQICNLLFYRGRGWRHRAESAAWSDKMTGWGEGGSSHRAQGAMVECWQRAQHCQDGEHWAWLWLFELALEI